MRSYYNIGHKLSLVGRYVTHIFLSITRFGMRKRGYHINHDFFLFSFATTAGLFIFENYIFEIFIFHFYFFGKIFFGAGLFSGIFIFRFSIFEIYFLQKLFTFLFSPLTKTFYYNVEL